MILTKEVIININKNNIFFYKKKYKNLNIGDELKINITELSRGSNIKIRVKCDLCGDEKEVVYKTFNKSGYNEDYYLCKKCKCKINNKEKYGVENVFQIDSVKEKIKKTNIKRYGVDNISQSEQIKEKKIQTSIEKYGYEHHLKNLNIVEKQKNTVKLKYGVDNVSQLLDIKEKKKETTLKNYDVEYAHQSEKVLEKQKNNVKLKYGVDYIFQNNDIKDKIKKTNLLKYGYEVSSKNVIIKNKISKGNILNKNKKTFFNNNSLININNEYNTFELKCDCGKEHIYTINRILYYKRNETLTTKCTICNPINKNISGLEKQLIDFIVQNYNGEVLLNNKKIISPYEIDIYLPELKLGFEFNGLYWHSELYKTNNYHRNKTEMCVKNEIQLVHIYEDDWLYKNDIIKSVILNKLKRIKNRIYSRNCEIKIVDSKCSYKFLEENHIQGGVNSSIRIGLYYKNELVSLMTFKNNNRTKYIELNRYCNKINTSVIGSASKLFKYFLSIYNKSKVVSYADRGYSYGGIYDFLGFKKNGFIKETYYYIVDGKRRHKSNYSKKKISNESNKNKSEHEIMLEHGIYRIYNSGLIKYIYK